MASSADLIELLMNGALRRDIPRFQARLRQVARLPDEDAAWGKLVEDINHSRDARERRTKLVPALNYPPELPVSAAKDEIAAAIRDHQVVVLAGETGSGKTTQLPKICLELGRGIDGTIGHTQPRRIAARTVAARIADELGTHVGGVVGYKVRFTDQSGGDSLIKLMTDGILLAETQSDPMLRQYDTIIIDEAHERTLNIDFLLGYLRQLLPKRPDLKLIITSATIDPQRFSKHFGDLPGGCPMLEVSGRTYPVEVRYRPTDIDDAEKGEALVAVDPIEAIVNAVDEVRREGPGDVLVFLASEREIRESAAALAERLPADFEIMSLFARLSTEDQQRVFKPGHRRRVVLATNVAETSITVPNIRYVVDPGEARISRYSTRTKVQRLPIEPISQASANQRKGRCGRVGPGVCVRLYSEEEFNSRPAFTDPEILRTNLASVILQMAALKLGDVSAFPFLDPPDTRQIRDGYNTLWEIGAVTEERHLTELGRRLARLPTDPRIGRMILAALDEGVLDEVLVIAAALSVQDPRDRPMEHAQAADAAHAAFRDESSDFMGMLRLWETWRAKSWELSSSKLRKWCREHFLSYTRMREWQETHRQIRTVAAESLVDNRSALRRGRRLEHGGGKTDASNRNEGAQQVGVARQGGAADQSDAPREQADGGHRQGRRGRRDRGRGRGRGEPAATSSPTVTSAGEKAETQVTESSEAITQTVVEGGAPDVTATGGDRGVRRRGRRGRGGRGNRGQQAGVGAEGESAGHEGEQSGSPDAGALERPAGETPGAVQPE